MQAQVMAGRSRRDPDVVGILEVCKELQEAHFVTGPLMGCSHMYTMGSEELLASLLSSFSRAPLNCWYLQRSRNWSVARTRP